jgi:hypothetical protein
LDLRGRKWWEAGEDFITLYASPNVIKVTKSRRIKLEGHVKNVRER